MIYQQIQSVWLQGTGNADSELLYNVIEAPLGKTILSVQRYEGLGGQSYEDVNRLWPILRSVEKQEPSNPASSWNVIFYSLAHQYEPTGDQGGEFKVLVTLTDTADVTWEGEVSG